MSKDKLTELVSFRISESEYEPYRLMIENTGIKKSKLMRDVFIAKSGCMVEPKEDPKDKKRLMFLASKTSNNINQLAKKVNQAYRAGVVSERVYRETLNNLISIEKSFSGAIKKC
ncbi:hypothetical protein OAA_18540 [Vibrio cyclitrophicus 1F175]|uniref:plasmid mobilization protein n=1 Tax=Vibrio TaxID=662 RepID=UPI00037B6B81|nr:plasmid mobilization relaxosome protein MobC [Vibrio cyclitrophicus]OEF62202.1 hypothetical protein OAA_18540 [Vibrio cyclitrophicus 1F175]